MTKQPAPAMMYQIKPWGVESGYDGLWYVESAWGKLVSPPLTRKDAEYWAVRLNLTYEAGREAGRAETGLPDMGESHD